jgi:hypothetical protein
MPHRTVTTDAAAPPGGPYSQATVAGDFVSDRADADGDAVVGEPAHGREDVRGAHRELRGAQPAVAQCGGGGDRVLGVRAAQHGHHELGGERGGEGHRFLPVVTAEMRAWM